jgi:hypothetical protein
MIQEFLTNSSSVVIADALGKWVRFPGLMGLRLTTGLPRDDHPGFQGWSPTAVGLTHISSMQESRILVRLFPFQSESLVRSDKKYSISYETF